jgi:dienelactone hydrolase
MKPVLLAALLLSCLVSLAAAAQPADRTTDLPGADFSRYERTFPWEVSASYIAAHAAKPGATNWDESKVGSYTLPDMFALAGGGRVTSASVWEQQRRGELLALFQSEVYGVAPPRPDTLAFRVVETNPRAMDGQATLKRVAISFTLQGAPFVFHLTLFVPNQRSGKAPVFLLLNHRGVENTDPTRQKKMDFWPAEDAIARGYAIAAINVAAEVDPDQRNATTGVRQFYRAHHPQPESLTWATLSAWAWSGSRAVDYFETDADLDPARIAVIGHSRTGKTALWAAAQDTRFALACVNCAGEGGPSLARRNFGETLGQVAKNFPYWFTPKYTTYADKVDALPIDTHELIALVAPRGYHGSNATLDLHADPRGSWLALVEASRVWALYGRAVPMKPAMPRVNELFLNGPIAYHLLDGEHALTRYDWKLYLDHADRFFAERSK